MIEHASKEDCPCCHECIAPGIDTDRALVVAFIGGASAQDAKIPMGEALCEKHAMLAADAMQFVIEHAPS